MKLDGTWVIETPEGEQRSVAFENCGEAWLINVAEQENSPAMAGVAFEHEGILCVSRGVVSQQAELEGSVGLIRYDVRSFGDLPARWFHPSLGNSLSNGLSTNGPTDTIFGEYRADYNDSKGTPFDPLKKTISDAGDRILFAWWDETRFHYCGVGAKIDDNLFAAWGPPGSIIQFVKYDLTVSPTRLKGEWIDYGRARSGIETLVQISPNSA